MQLSKQVTLLAALVESCGALLASCPKLPALTAPGRQNFPSGRGSVVGVLKAAIGLSGELSQLLLRWAMHMHARHQLHQVS